MVKWVRWLEWIHNLVPSQQVEEEDYVICYSCSVQSLILLFYCHVRTFAFLFIQPAVTLFAHYQPWPTFFNCSLLPLRPTLCLSPSAYMNLPTISSNPFSPIGCSRLSKRPRPLKMVSHAEVGDLARMDSEFGFFQQVEEAEKEDKGFNSI